MAVMPPDALPLGYRFHPTEEELVGHYLRRKIGGVRTVIPEIDVYKYEPWDLPDKSLIRSDDQEWFFFSQKDRKYPTGHRSNRATKAGYWKATGRDREIRTKPPAAPCVIGMKKILVFHLGRAPKGVNTNWIMHEYRCSQPEYVFDVQGGYALYRLFRKVEEKNVYCRSDGSILYPLPPKSSPGDTQHEEDDSEEIDAPVISKPIQFSVLPAVKEEQTFLSETVENQSSGMKRWLPDNEDHVKVVNGYCNNHMALDVEGNHKVKGGSEVCDPRSPRVLITTAETAATTTKHCSNDDLPMDVIPTTGVTLAPIVSAAQVELTDNQTSSSESSKEYPSETVVEDSNLCHATADGSSSSCKLVDTKELNPSSSASASQTQLKFEGKVTAVPPEVLPLGFRFHPTDVELVSHYLKRKLNGQIREIDIIPEIDICKCEPWDVPYKSPIGLDASEWFFFSSKDKKYPTGNRANRATRGGYWKVSGRDRAVRSKSPAAVIGMKKSLIYYQGRAPKGVHTHWVMHEYRATEPEFESGEQAGLVIYRLFRKGDEKNQNCTADEMERSGLSSSPTKSSPGDTENEGDGIELDAPIRQVSPVSDLQQERLGLSNTVENQSSGVTTCLADKADFSSLKPKPEGSFNDNLVVVDVDSDDDGKVGETLVSRCLSSLFTSTTRRKPSPEIIKVSPIESAAPAAFSADRDPISVLSMTDTKTKVNESTMLSRINIRPLGIDPNLRHARSSGHIKDNEEPHPASSTLVGQIQERCRTALCSHLTAIATRASSCDKQSFSDEVSTDSSHISVHLRLLRTLFSKSLPELTLELLKGGAESAKVVSSASGMQKDLAKHLLSVIDQAYALRVHLDQQNQIIGLNQEPMDQLERLEADMPRLTARLESLQLDIDKTVALVLQRRLQFGGPKENLAELRDELGRLSSTVASKERQIKKLRAEKPRRELTITLASNFIKKLEADYAALAEPFRDYFVPAN